MSEADEILRRRAQKSLGAIPEEFDRIGFEPTREPAKQREGDQRVRLLRLSEIQEEPVRWIWPHRLARGKLAILEGHPGLGKSTLTTAVAAAVSSGGTVAGHLVGAPEHVVLLSYEDARADTLIPRLLAADGEPSRVHLPELDVPEGMLLGLQLPTHILALERALADQEIRPALIVVDPLGEALSASVDSHRESEVRHALAALTAFATRIDACVLLVRHLRTQSTGRAVTSGGGSIGFTAAARVVMRVDEDPDSPKSRLLSIVKNNLAPKDPTLSFELVASSERSVATIRWRGEVDWSADELDGAESRGRSDTHSAVRTWLESVLSGGEKLSREVHRLGAEEGFSRSSIERASSALGVSRRAHGVGGEKRSTWSLPAEARGDGFGS